MAGKTRAGATAMLAAAMMVFQGHQARADQAVVDDLAQNLKVTWEVVNSFPDPPLECPEADWQTCFSAAIQLAYHGAASQADHAWEIYFSSIHRILDSDNPEFSVEHVTGDLTVLKPTGSFSGFTAGGTVTIPVVVEFWQMFDTDTMPRWYVASEGAAPKVIQNTDTEDMESFMILLSDGFQSPADTNMKMTVENRKAVNDEYYGALTAEEIAARFIPSPLQLTLGEGSADVAGGITVDTGALPADMQKAVAHLMKAFEIPEGPYKVSVSIGEVPAEANTADGYTLTTSADGASVVGHDVGGAFYGIMSLLGLLPKGGQATIPAVSITDAPRFGYRGMHCDVSRNFHSKESILRLLDAMAMYKMNKFHFHLSDDEGWRLEIPDLPELTAIGGRRCHDPAETTCTLPQLGSGPDAPIEQTYFTVQDYIDILKYAQARNIEVIPELDMPGHSRAAVVSMEARGDSTYRLLDPEDTTHILTVQFYDRRSFMNPCLDSTYAFVRKVISEVQKMHQTAGVPLNVWHFGGDEAKNILTGGAFDNSGLPDDMRLPPFSNSPACAAYSEKANVPINKLMSHFASRVGDIVTELGIEILQAWQDGLKNGEAKDYAPKVMRANVWETLFWGGADVIQEFSERGFELILSNPDYLYFDFPNEFNPRERGYYWAARSQTLRKPFLFTPENIPMNGETSVGRDGSEFSVDSKAPSATPIKGISGQFWSESVRTDEQMEYMIFPRMIAVAERAWHRASWELPYKQGVTFNQSTTHTDKAAMNKDFREFANVLSQRELAKLDALGIAFRLAPPGFHIDSTGLLSANTEQPGGAAIEYSVDGADFLFYDGPVSVPMGSKVSVRSSFNGRHSRVETIDMSDCPCLGENNGAGCVRDPNHLANQYSCPATDAPETEDAAGEAAPVPEREQTTEIITFSAILGINVVLLGFISFKH